MMKTFIATVVCALVVVSHQEDFNDIKDDYEALIGPIKRTCLSESNAKEELVDALISRGEYMEDRNVKCYLKCLYLKLDILNEAGDIIEESVKKTSGVDQPDMQEKVYQKCKTITGKDLCEKAFNLSQCTYQTVKELVRA